MEAKKGVSLAREGSDMPAVAGLTGVIADAGRCLIKAGF
jgi:hypothetical protein